MNSYKFQDILFSIFLLLLVSFFCSCSKEEDKERSEKPAADTVTPAPHPQPVATGHLVAVLDSAAMTLDEFATAISTSPIMAYTAEMLGENATMVKEALQTLLMARRPVMDALFMKSVGLDKQMRRQWQMETYVFSYTSVTPAGEPVTLSGRVTFPNNSVNGVVHKLDSYTLYSHQFTYFNDWVPSRGFSLLSARALYNSAVIEPDEQGQGIDQGLHGVIYISSDVRARQLSDCAMAAREIMRRHGVELSDEGYSTNWGNSFAASAALSYARYYDLYASAEERAAIRLKSTFAANGPYIYDELFLYKNKHPEYNSTLTLALFALDGLSQQQRYGYAAGDFAPEWLKDNKVTGPDGNEYTLLYAASHCFDDYIVQYFEKYQYDSVMTHYVAPDMQTEEGHLDLNNDKTKAFLKIMHEQSVYDGWKPTTDIYMAHHEGDEVTPYSTVRNIYNNICSRGNGARQKMHWMDSKVYLKNLQEERGVHEPLACEAMVWMMLAPEPKDMAMFYD